MSAKFTSTGLRVLFSVWIVALLMACTLSPQLSGTSPIAAEPRDGETSSEEQPDLMTVLIVGLVLTGVVLVVLAFLFLLRKRQRDDNLVGATAYLSHPTSPSPSVLSEKTLLNNGRYRVLKIHSASEAFNVYMARGTIPLSRCPRCDASIEGDEVQFCTHCGTDLSGVTLVYPKFTVRETAEARVLGESSQLVALHLSHPALILPVDVFMETTSAPLRYYRVEPIFKCAVDLTIPQLPEKVLLWGITLAQGMAYLHQRYLVLRQIDLEHLVVSNGNVSWVCIDNVHILAQEVYAQADAYFTANVQALARLLQMLLTGPQDAQVSADVIALLAHVQSQGATATTFAAFLEQALHRVRAPENVRLQVAQLTDVGKMRSLNEDSMLALDYTEHFLALGVPVGVFAIADGMGGHTAGDVASQLTIKAVVEAVKTLDVLTEEGALFAERLWLEQTVLAANQTVYTQRKVAANDMGCTLVLALVIGGHVTIANVGDSRAYWLAENGATQITTDHSLVERLVAAGHITVQQARAHPQRNVIYRVIGDKPKPEFDLFEQLLAPGEALLLCSDGLSGMITDDQIWQLWRDAPSPQAACERMVEAANRAGGTDNISIVLVQVSAV